MSEDLETFDVLMRKPREGQRELIISIPKYIQDKLKLGKNTLLDLIVMDNFVVVKRSERTEYRAAPLPEILTLLDEGLTLFREHEQMKDSTGQDMEAQKRVKVLKERILDICKKISDTVKERGTSLGGLSFSKGVLTETDVALLIEDFKKKQDSLGEHEVAPLTL